MMSTLQDHHLHLLTPKTLKGIKDDLGLLYLPDLVKDIKNTRPQINEVLDIIEQIDMILEERS